MTEDARQFLKSNMNLLNRNDFIELFKRARNYIPPNEHRRKNVWPEVYEVFMDNGINPLEDMSEIPEYFFDEVNISKLIIPKNINKLESGSICDNNLVSLFIENPNIKLTTDCIHDLPKLQSLNFPSGMVVIPKMNVQEVPSLRIIRVPETVVRISASAFSYIPKDCVIVTPYREAANKKLNISESEIDFYKQHLRFTHAPKNVEVKDEI